MLSFEKEVVYFIVKCIYRSAVVQPDRNDDRDRATARGKNRAKLAKRSVVFALALYRGGNSWLLLKFNREHGNDWCSKSAIPV